MTDAPCLDPQATRALMERAIGIAGSEKKLGEACGCSQHKIWKAKVSGSPDAELAIRIENATGVPAREMRPDLPWPSAPAGQLSA